eukprot:maker-scaffold506_size152672-snap-gene-0.29 protein:Tk07584 transcript:maker-scaffold506_size152672-snap-gene-0.29-mRNA-1 annotation:"Uncharacterized protein KIAA0195"
MASSTTTLKGLTTHFALNRLITGMEEKLSVDAVAWGLIVTRALSARSLTSLFPWTLMVLSTLTGLCLVVAGLAQSSTWLLGQGLLVWLWVLVNLALTLWEHSLKEDEMRARVAHVIRRLRQVKEHIHWNPTHYPHLHTPMAASIVLQWTIRDKKQVNLPWALLVESDLVFLKPGQAAPGRCHSFDDPSVRLVEGDLLHVDTHHRTEISPTPEFKNPAKPQLFIMDETPYLSMLELVLRRKERVHKSVLNKHTYLLFVQILSHCLFPLALALSLVWSLIRQNQVWNIYGADDYVELFLIQSVAVVLPLVSFSFPLCYLIVNYLGMAWILGVYSSSRHLRVNDDPFDDSREIVLTPEILTITHDPHNPTLVEFDDPNWRRYLPFLKPLGLGIVLNTCNIQTEEKYTNFFNHLTCESMKNEDSARSTHSSKDNVINMLPIVTRGCLCELSRKIGFDSKTAHQYSLSSQIQTFRHVQTHKRDRFAKNLMLAKLKFPFPHMVSVMVQDRATGSRQLISQGTGDIVLDSCTDCWCGDDLEPLTEDLRKKILDFYQRASLSSYATAFSYRPQTFPLAWKNCAEYLQLPTHSLPFYWQYNEETEGIDTDAITSHISISGKHTRVVGNKGKGDDNYVKTKEDAMHCLELQCNQTFVGMIQLQYQVMVEIVQLVDLLEKACIRFVHFSRENELRSRVFSEKMGLESGWNCHISLRSPNPPQPNTVSTYGNNKALKDSPSSLEQNRFRSSLPDKLNRPVWFLDFPRWQETKGGLRAERRLSRAELIRSGKSNHSSSENIEDSLESHGDASVTTDSDPFEYDMSNRAQLPRGIENIRPHLETMDNVPLLVSLFTDSTAETTKEMVKIMQEYGEVICVMGSSANYKNIPTFLQSDASMAIEPRYPQLCQAVPVSTPPKVGPSPVAISQLLNSVASSLSFKMEDEISIFHLIMESRHFTLTLINGLKFWACTLVTLSLLQMCSIFLTLPLFMTIGQVMWMSMLVLPLLSLSLLGTKKDPNIMNISTGKNNIVMDCDLLKYSIWCYGSRFVPTIFILAFCHLLTTVSLIQSCTEEKEAEFNATKAVLESEEDWELLSSNVTIECQDADIATDIVFPQLFNFIFTFLYMAVISMSFISRSHQIWQRHPGKNLVWLVMTALLAVFVAVYTMISILAAGPGHYHAPLHVWVLLMLGLIFVAITNEVVKRQEIKVDVRYQKRERLEFGTKLGINSPF